MNTAYHACIEAEYSKGRKFAQDFDAYLKKQTQQRVVATLPEVQPLEEWELEVVKDVGHQTLVTPGHHQAVDSSKTSETKAQEDTTLLSSYTASILPLTKQELEVEHEAVDKQLVEPVHQQDGDCHDEQFEHDFNACLSMVQKQA